ncbi:3-deoxy-D-manno-octulosonic acid transferase [Desulfurispirillum indicum]|uniref:3-deoxy-D-manno-octulosonic acid transferase n=1 Tax=Desulfurispirillum indicum (strain ATCC BAA-1389 / DSM 22839 / S5) TaxID=653733 RepID=E6W2K5_DESIS|nr:3-deoxy-D-manno-octulosonic acid transferase [Desulfurispirillum indicum]ADU65589.1 Three-deoxy-D-manno-octulosonic-acid transferase domain-containing protein [Desulfurispirillum indicum S5]UCZ57579.1 3-deoxy-D-manno-octulosonic acid transferase [Desulfurispirillum indicum]
MFLYNILLHLLGLVLAPVHLVKIFFARSRIQKGTLQRLGFFRRKNRILLQNLEKTVLIHAASVGETRAAIPLIKKIYSDSDGYHLILSNVTDTGNLIGQTIDQVYHCLYLPFDFPFAVRRFLRVVRPCKIIIIETEIWPNFIREATRMGIPVYIANGRISEKSFGRYRALRWFFGPILRQVQRIFARTDEDKRRFLEIGVNASQVEVAGNVKFDLAMHDQEESEWVENFRDDLKLPDPDEVDVLCFGSIHPSEDEMVLQTHKRLLDEGQEIVSILAPRHIERQKQLLERIEESGFKGYLRTELPTKKKRLKSGDILVLNTIGELIKAYAVSNVVFVGGSFDQKVQGHNILEACGVGKPVIFGPYMDNFTEIAVVVRQWEAGNWIMDQEELFDSINGLLTNPALARHMGDQARALLRKNQGAVDRIFAAVFRK